MRIGVSVVAAMAALLAACSAGGESGERDSEQPPIGDGIVGEGEHRQGDVTFASALVPFDACDDLLDYVIGHAREMVGPWGLGGGAMYGMALEESATADLDTSAGAAGRDVAAPVEGEDYSGTNVQEAGVDEPDTVKTDGEYLYLLRGTYLDIVDVRTDSPRLISSTELGGRSDQLLRSGDRLLVLGYAEGGAHPLGRADSAIWTSSTMLSLYDVSDPSDPELVSTLQVDGYVAAARLVDGVARVVLHAEPVGLPFVSPEGNGLRAEREATEQNREIVEESTVDNWVPYYVHESADGTDTEDALLDCEQLQRPDEFSGLGTTTVMSLDLADDLIPRGSMGVLAGGDTVYASAERLYVATNRWVDWVALSDDMAQEANERFTTDIHAFDITDPDAAEYVGSGTVRGHVADQWSMSEYEGVLRVASTDGSPRWEEGPAVSESYVTTFTERDGTLAQLGQVGGLGKNERIYAVRFMGDLGYVVTFRETDPLYTIDLSDPENPRVVGELKILGYSAYLHPVGDDLLLGVGQDADERGRTKGMQLSLFDVSDLADPQRLDQVTLSDASTEAEWNHHAFLYWPKTGLTVLPFQRWSWDERTEIEKVESGAIGYRVDEAAGIDEIGHITHLPGELGDSSKPGYYDVAWRAGIERSIVIDDSLVTISNLGVMVSDLTTLDGEGWLRLPVRDF